MSVGAAPARREGDTLILELRVHPRASRDRVAGRVGDRFKVQVTAPPVDDAANRRLVELIATEFGVARSRVRVLAGATGRNKRVAVDRPTRRPPWLTG